MPLTEGVHDEESTFTRTSTLILGIHHVANSVPDLERAVAFYCGVLGFEEVMASETPGDSPQFDAIIGLKEVSARMRGCPLKCAMS